MKAIWKIFGVIFCLTAMLVMPQLALATGGAPEVWVNGVDILQAENNTVQCGGGTAVYDTDSSTLTLTNATLDAVNSTGNVIEAKRLAVFNIVLAGENSITSDGKGIIVNGSLNIKSSAGGKLVIDTVVSNSIYGSAGVIIDGANVSVASSKASGILAEGDMEIKNDAVVTAKSDLCPGLYILGNLIITDSEVNSASAGDVGIYSSSGTVVAKDENGVILDGDLEDDKNKGNITISGSKVNATAVKQSGLYAIHNIDITDRSEITAEGLNAGIEVYYGNLHISDSTVNAKATAAEAEEGDGILCESGNVTIDGKADVTAAGFMSGIYTKDMGISDSVVEAVSDGNIGLQSTGDMIIENSAHVTAEGYCAGIWADRDVRISGSEVKAESTVQKGDLQHRGCGIFAYGDMNIVNGTVQVACANGIGLWCSNAMTIGGESDVDVNALEMAVAGEKSLNIAGSKVQANSATGIGIWSNGIMTISEKSDVAAKAPMSGIANPGGLLTISGSTVKAEAGSDGGVGILALQTEIKEGSDVTAHGAKTGMECEAGVKIGGSKVKTTGKTGIDIGSDPEQGDLYITNSWLETSSKTNQALIACDSVLIEPDGGFVVGNAIVPDNAVIGKGQILTISKEETLTVPGGKSLTVEPGGKLLIEEGGKLTVAADGGKVTIEQGATYKNNGTVEGTVTEIKGSGGGSGGGSASAGNQDKEPDNDADTNVDTAKGVSSFADIKSGQWFYDDVKFVCEKGLMNGASETAFDPSGTATRGMLAAILWRNEKEPVVNYLMKFNDVKQNAYYAEAVRWAVSEGIVKGYVETQFAPDEEITREQLAAVLYRYAKIQGADVSKTGDIAGFADAGKVSAWAQEPLKWAVGNGIINGQGDNTLNPQGMAQRADIAAMLHRFLDTFSK